MWTIASPHCKSTMKPKRFGPLVEHAGSGLRLPESLARKIDDLSRRLPRDVTYRRLARKSDSLALDPGERTDVSVITTDALDREGECVLPDGGDWSTYNRVVTFAHRYDQLPVGSNWWIRPKGNSLVAKTHYPQKPADWGEAPWLPSAVLHLMQQSVPTCTGKSIGFLPLNVRSATSDEISRRPELRGMRVIDRWVGVEYAVVPVPCNPQAEMQAVAKELSRGTIDEKTLNLIRETAAIYESLPTGGSAGYTRRETDVLDPIALRQRIIRQVRETYRELTGKVC